MPTSITAWSAISSIGIGRKEFVEGRAQERVGVRPVEGEPVRRAGLVPGFTVPAYLGTRNTRSMDRLTGLAVATAGMVLDEAGDGAPTGDTGPVGVVLGTTSGSIASVSDFTRDSLVGAKPTHVNPAHFPNTVMNCAAGQTAIRYGLTGPNTTISGGHLSGLLALRYACRILRVGYAGAVLAGSAEEYCRHRAWGDRHLRPRAHRAARPLGEGSAMFLLGDAARSGPPALAELAGFRFGVHREGPEASGGAPVADDARAAAVLARCLRRLLADTGVDPSEVWAVSLGDDPATAGAERTAVEDVLGGHRPAHELRISTAVGDTFSAGGSLQLAAVLAAAELDGGPGRRPCLVTGVAADGGVGAALVRA